MARGKAKGKGVRMQGCRKKGKGKGMSIEDRRRKLTEIKARSNCEKCGKKGHWAGDPECTAKAAHLAVGSDRVEFEKIESGSEESSEDDLPSILEEEESDACPISLSASYQAGRSRVAYMAVRPPSPDAPGYRAFVNPSSPDLATEHSMLQSQIQADWFEDLRESFNAAPERQKDESHSSFSWIHLGVHPRIEPNNRVAHLAVRSSAPKSKPAPNEIAVSYTHLTLPTKRIV